MLVVTPNLCFDVTVLLPALVPGSVMRASSTATTAGGKGINVVRSSTSNGVTGTRLLGFLPVEDGHRLRELATGEGIDLAGVPAEGAVRVCTIFLEQNDRTTVVNGRGSEISAAQWAAFVEVVALALQPGEVLVCSGSLPPGVPVDGYAQLVAVAHAQGSPAVVDAAPAALVAALAERPDLVSPNLSEAEGLLFGRVDEQVNETGDDIPQRAAAAAAELFARGAVRAVVTAGAAGAALATDAGTWWLTAPAVAVVSPIGAGDSFVGGAAPLLEATGQAGELDSRPPSAPDSTADVDLVVAGMATASASCEQQLAGGVDPVRVRELAGQITVAVLGTGARVGSR